MKLGLYVYEMRQNIPNRFRMEIFCVIYRFVCSSTKIMRRIIYLQGGSAPPILYVMITGIPIL